MVPAEMRARVATSRWPPVPSWTSVPGKALAMRQRTGSPGALGSAGVAVAGVGAGGRVGAIAPTAIRTPAVRPNRTPNATGWNSPRRGSRGVAGPLEPLPAAPVPSGEELPAPASLMAEHP